MAVALADFINLTDGEFCSSEDPRRDLFIPRQLFIFIWRNFHGGESY